MDTCHEIVLLGYGFPETDINNLLFFLGYKQKISHIVVKEHEHSQKLARLRDIFGETIVKNIDAKEFIRSTYIDPKSNSVTAA
jgi:hypothetical protein